MSEFRNIALLGLLIPFQAEGTAKMAQKKKRAFEGLLGGGEEMGRKR